MLENILIEHEGKTLEFKENLQALPNIIKTVIAFANTAGGMIILGVEDRTKKVIGIKDPLDAEERLSNAICDSIEPQIRPDIEIKTYGNKELIIINVPHATGPIYLKSLGLEKGTYVRLGSTNRVADSETLQSLKNFALNVLFDELPYVQGKESDLDWTVIKQLFTSVDKQISSNQAYTLGLITNHGLKIVPSYGGLILFGKNRLKLFPEAKIRCVRFLGVDRTEILDQLDLDIYLPLALEDAIKFIRRNTAMRAEIVESLARKDLPEYPHIAIREALTNAVLHADYAIRGVYISIAIFDDRLEITNPGGLPFGFTMHKALAGASRIRNRVIAKVFYQLKWIEQWGTGIQRIIKECDKAGLEAPSFAELNNQFRVTLYSAKLKSKLLSRSKKNSSKAAIAEKWQQNFVIYLKHQKQLSTSEAAVFWKITPRAARLRLIKLIDMGLIYKTGTSLRDPFGFYILAK